MPLDQQLLLPGAREALSQGVSFHVAGLLGAWFADDLRATLADTDPVTTWGDATGNGNDLGNTGTNRPTFDAVNPQFNGHASVNFAKASTQALFGTSLPIATALSGSDKPFTIFAVVRRSTKISADEYVWTLGNTAQASQSYASGGYRYQNSNSQRVNSDVRDDAGTAATNSTGLNEIADLAPQVLCWSMSGTTASIYIAGASQNPLYDALANSNGTGSDYSAQGTITFDQFSLGGQRRATTVSKPCDLEIACVLVYDRELNAADRQRISEHLWNTYAPRVIAAPTDIPDCSHWWDASQLAGAEASDVDTWEDLVGSIDFAATGFDAPVVALHENGNKVVHFQGTDDALDSAAAADGNFLHNNTDYSLFVVYRVEAADEALQPILDTNGGSTTARGFSLAHDGASAAHSLQIKIGNGTTNVVNHDSQDYGSRPGAWHVAHITHEGTLPSSEEEYQIWLDNENYAAVDAANAEDTGDAAGAITLGKLAGAATFATVKIAEIIAYSRKLGRPGESKLVHDYLARKWSTSHAALVAGNGLAGILDDATSHRGFPALCQDSRGVWHCIYRRALDHGNSRGVGVHITSADGIRWSPERVIYDVDDADGRDFRGGGSFICLAQGPHAGRLLHFTNWQDDISDLEIPGFGSTNLLGISDDNGGTWTWSNPQQNDPKNVYQSPWVYTVANAAGMIELSTGRILMTFASKDNGMATADQDLNLAYSDDGGETWSDSVIIGLHDVAFNNQANKRITESWIVEWDDGALSMFVRNDTDLEIWRATANISDVEDWTFDAAKLFDGWGRPMAVRDPNDTDGLYIFHRADTADATYSDFAVWRYSSDRGATWSGVHLFSNLSVTTTLVPFTQMSYHYAAVDNDGHVWVACGLEESTTDSDIFVRRWENVQP
jgi:hypothetical protein